MLKQLYNQNIKSISGYIVHEMIHFKFLSLFFLPGMEILLIASTDTQIRRIRRTSCEGSRLDRPINVFSVRLRLDYLANIKTKD